MRLMLLPCLPCLPAARKGGSGGGAATRGGSGKQRGGKGGSSEDVEIFSIDSGWNVDALEGLSDLLDVDGSEGWSVEAAPRGSRASSGASTSSGSSVPDADDGWGVDAVFTAADVDLEGLDVEDEEGWEEEAPSGGAAAAPAAPQFGGRRLGRAEQQLLASLPAHVVARLEEEQLEADEGGCGWVGVWEDGWVRWEGREGWACCSAPPPLQLAAHRAEVLASTAPAHPWPAEHSEQHTLPLPPLSHAHRARQAAPGCAEEGGSPAADASAAAHHLRHSGGAALEIAAGRPGGYAAWLGCRAASGQWEGMQPSLLWCICCCS